MMHHALVAGQVLKLGSENLQDSEAECCKSCLDTARCTAWVYCPRPGGCAADASLVTLVRRDSGTASAPTPEDQLRQLQLPSRGCRLLSIPAFRLHKDSPQILANGTEVPFVSGARQGAVAWPGVRLHVPLAPPRTPRCAAAHACPCLRRAPPLCAGTPVTITLPVLPGYSVRPGTDTASGLGYKCAESLLSHSCLLQGTVKELAAQCTADPLCKAFVYLPNGVDSLSEPIGILKGGPGVTSLSVADMTPNPSTALYIDLSVETTLGGPAEGSDQADGHADADADACDCSGISPLWLVLPCAIAAILAVMAGYALYMVVCMRQQVQQVAEAAPVAKGVGIGGSSSGSASPRGGSSGKPSPPMSGAAPPATLPPLGLRKPSPPTSNCSEPGGHSGGSTPSMASGSGDSCSSSSVQCPQCGTSLNIRYRMQQRAAAPASPARAVPPSSTS